jgi:hypothetical protein
MQILVGLSRRNESVGQCCLRCPFQMKHETSQKAGLSCSRSQCRHRYIFFTHRVLLFYHWAFLGSSTCVLWWFAVSHVLSALQPLVYLVCGIRVACPWPIKRDGSRTTFYLAQERKDGQCCSTRKVVLTFQTCCRQQFEYIWLQLLNSDSGCCPNLAQYFLHMHAHVAFLCLQDLACIPSSRWFPMLHFAMQVVSDRMCM